MFVDSTLVFNKKISSVLCINLSLRFRIRNSVHEKVRNSSEFRGIKLWKILQNSAEVKSLSHKIPYTAEFQKFTSVNTLVPAS
jgi:hypothetical protein